MIKKVAEFQTMLEKCGFGRLSSSEVTKNLSACFNSLDKEACASFCEYILTNIRDAEILYVTVKISDSCKTSNMFLALLDILLWKNFNINNKEDYINVRALSARMIANYKDTSAVETLLLCLNNKSENYKVRLACADALGRIGDTYAVAPLIDLAKDEEEKSVYVRESAVFALGLIGDTHAIEPLVAIMEAKQGVVGKFSFLKEKIVEALGRLNLNNLKVLNALKKALMDTSPMVRINAIEALMNSDYIEADELIRKALSDEDEDVRRNALIALYNMNGDDILEEIISLPVYDDFLKFEAQVLKDEYSNAKEYLGDDSK